RAVEYHRVVLSDLRPPGAQHEGKRPGPVAGAPHRARARWRGGGGKRAGKRQQVHSVVAAGRRHAAAVESSIIRGYGIMKTRINFTARPKGRAPEARSG